MEEKKIKENTKSEKNSQGEVHNSQNQEKEKLSFEQLQQAQEELQKELEELKTKCSSLAQETESWKGKCARLVNNFEAANKQSLELVKYANEELLRKFLFFLDVYQEALKMNRNNSDNKDSKINAFLKGFEMSMKEFEKILADQEIKKIEVKVDEDLFDFDLHQVLEVVENSEKPDSVILEVAREGYLLKERILRPSLVKINKNRAKQK